MKVRKEGRSGLYILQQKAAYIVRMTGNHIIDLHHKNNKLTHYKYSGISRVEG